MLSTVTYCFHQLRERMLREYYQMVNSYLKKKMGYCGSSVNLLGMQRITGISALRLAENVGIAENSLLRCEAGVVVGGNTRISRNFVLYTVNHRYEGEWLPYDDQLDGRPVYIGTNVWIGMNVMVLPGSLIGEGAVVGAGSVVRGVIPPLAIAFGNPAIVARFRNEERYRRLRELKYFGGVSGSKYWPKDSYNPLAELDVEIRKRIEVNQTEG